ncbi:hypothetical protein NUKP104_49900 [Klebsiella variicola]|uniref:AbiTii domain-containing protein n=1 Tax=Klebsiella variicola TaxID=244366 RepID=A0ABD7PE98_KLEVA|nr:hypothetical protein [Klebsiella variicola]GJK07285.1 hypothetical protein TUM16656_56330 [Klebsiella pneumoniae]EIY5132226.1 hypothetical protein [Klebsiella variicola]EKU8544801.1 hypothetical protein [Klebsiella variicola]ESM66418.1 hypothetical protein L386_05044 [Klebsiella variicola]MBR7398595.1 hypothetical protein [Klebsiella variicola]
MTALVPELVNAAIDATVSPSDLLRRGLVVARRLAVPERVDWLSCELNGYYSEEVPDYRHLQGQLMVENPVRGPIPFFAPPEMAALLSDFEVRQSVPELIELAQSTTGLYCHFPADLEHILMKMIREANGVTMRPTLKFSTIQVQGIIEKVRSRILEWALDLEGQGVLGEGMTFTQQEKQIVQPQHYHFRDVSSSQIQIGSNSSSQTQTQTGGDMAALSALIALLHDAIRQGNIETEAREELQAELATLQAQAASPKPKWAVIKATAGSIKAVLENAAGGILAAQALPYLTALL